jgi:hypothetical protein
MARSEETEEHPGDDDEAIFYHTPSTPHTKDNTPADAASVVDSLYSSYKSLGGQSITREKMVTRITDMGLQRPSASILYRRTV